jgi:hypothetical protein
LKGVANRALHTANLFSRLFLKGCCNFAILEALGFSECRLTWIHLPASLASITFLRDSRTGRFEADALFLESGDIKRFPCIR